MKKSIISSSIIAALGLTAGAANATSVTGLTIRDVGSNTSNGAGNFSSALDGFSGAFQFKTNYINVAVYNGASTFTGDAGTGTMLGGGAANPTGSFTTGFTFSGPPFTPYTFGGGFVADITNAVLSVSTLDFGGNFGGNLAGSVNFNLPPDSNYPLEVLWVNATANATDFDVAFRWGHDITTADDPSLMYTHHSAQWVLEGCASTAGNVGAACGASAVPVPAAVWFFGTGLLGLVGMARRRKHKQ